MSATVIYPDRLQAVNVSRRIVNRTVDDNRFAIIDRCARDSLIQGVDAFRYGIPLFAAYRVNSRTIERVCWTVVVGDANNARNERERRSVLAGLIPTRGGIARRTNEIIYSARTRSATLGGAENNQRAETAQRMGHSFNTFALRSSKIQPGVWSLPATPTRRVGQKWDTSVSENRAFNLSAILDRGGVFLEISSGCTFFARRDGFKGITADGFLYPSPLSSRRFKSIVSSYPLL